MFRYYILFLLYLPLFADSASVVAAQGGRIVISPHQHIEMLSEKITIDVYKNYAEFKVDYIFLNDSNSSQKVSMGFPQKKSDRGERLYNFKTFVQNRQIETFFQESDEEEKFDWYHFEVKFKPMQTKKIINSYWVYPTEYLGLYSLFYTLHTGASWKKNISKASIEVNLDEDFVVDVKQLAKSNLFIHPKSYKLSKDMQKLSWSFKHIEPSEDDDLEIYFVKKTKPFKMHSALASWTYSDEESQDSYFGVENLYDGELESSWATKSPDGLKKEWVEISFDDVKHDIVKIGIYPGFGSKESFMMADHVKKATLLFDDGSEKKIEFEEKPAMQYFDINLKNINSFKIRIDEVFKGTSNKKAHKNIVHISEVEVITKRNCLTHITTKQDKFW